VIWLAVAVAGAAGAVARYLVDLMSWRRSTGRRPVGTAVVNLTGSLLAGLVAGLAVYHGLGEAAVRVAGAGFCGGYTTFSALAFETVALAGHGERHAALANLVVNLAGGIVAAAAGFALVALAG
jgi:fluoride exporter